MVEITASARLAWQICHSVVVDVVPAKLPLPVIVAVYVPAFVAVLPVISYSEGESSRPLEPVREMFAVSSEPVNVTHSGEEAVNVAGFTTMVPVASAPWKLPMPEIVMFTLPALVRVSCETV